MTKNEKRKIWNSPWGYPESIAVAGGIITIGFMLQFSVGCFDFYLLARPVNIIAGIAILVPCLIMGLLARRNSFVKWLSGVEMSVTLIISLLLLSIIMGLIPQVTSETTSKSATGFDAMTRNWSFILIYLSTLLSLGTLIVRRFRAFHLRDYAFYANHIGLWILLAVAGLGYADMERYIMYVQEGETEWRVYDENKNVKELPIAIQLNDFDMDVYPPKLTIIDRNTGAAQPLDKPQYFQIDSDSPKGEVDGWQIEIEKYIHQAIRNSDSTYHEMPMPGATPAAKIIARKSGEVRQGWICAGSRAQLYMALPLDQQYSVVMTAAEPRSFLSDIEVYTQEEEMKSSLLEVNKPLRIGSWSIYQYGYDNDAGSLSSYSSFELVYDPWLMPVYIGILFMMFGSVTMLWTGRNRKEIKQ